jgi:hypothetical protein
MADILIPLAPLILLLIVVLFGFTGCHVLAEADPWPGEERRPTETGEPYNKVIEATTGFLALWPLNETSGTIASATSMAANVDGEYKPGATPGSEGAFFHKEPNTNFAPDLDGTSGHLEVPFNVEFNPSTSPRFSVELWAKPAGALPTDVEQILISSHHTSAMDNHRGYEIALVGTGAGDATVRARIFHVNDGTTSVDVPLASGDPTAWRHIVLTYDGPVNMLRLYATVTGMAFDKTAHENAGNYSPVQDGGAGERPLRFGAGHLPGGDPEKFFAGRIDEVAFYQGVLPDVTVEGHFTLF